MHITLKNISKESEKIIKRAEQDLARSSEVYIDKTINRKIDREISNLGKEKLIADHILNLAESYDNRERDKILFLFVRLYGLNKQVHESLIRELKNNKKLLNKRIKLQMHKKKAPKDIYKKLLAIADRHYRFVEHYAKNFNPNKKYPTSLIASVVSHKRKAEFIYKALANIKSRKTLHNILLHKLDNVFQSLINSTAELSNKIALVVKKVSNDQLSGLNAEANAIDDIITAKLEILREFAYKYSYNVIHSDHFFDLDGNKIILVAMADHR